MLCDLWGLLSGSEIREIPEGFGSVEMAPEERKGGGLGRSGC